MRRSHQLDARGMWLAVVLVATLAGVGCDSATAPPNSTTPPNQDDTARAPSAARIEAVTPIALDGIVGTAVAPAPIVRATDQHGNPVRGVSVSFALVRGGAVGQTRVETDANGLAGVGTWILDTAPGTQTLIARVDGLQEVDFAAVVTAGPPVRIAAVSGANQMAAVGEELPAKLEVSVSDAFGNRIAGTSLTFSTVPGDGAIDGDTIVTDVRGIATSSAWTLGPDAGVQRAQAVAGDAQVMFYAYAYVTAPAGAQREIAFVSERDGNSEIYVVNADGSNVTRLTTNSSYDGAPAWSPDGNRLAFGSTRDSTDGVHAMAADGSGVARLTSGRYDDEPAWSPSGSAIAFRTLRDGNTAIASVDVATRTKTLLTIVPGYHDQPSWSPTGQHLAFVSDRAAYDFVVDVYTMNADGTASTLRTDGPLSSVLRQSYHPAWSPDGSLIAFVRARIVDSKLRFALAVMTPDGVFSRDLAWATGVSAEAGLGGLAWSPDGSGIAYTFATCHGSSGSSCTVSRSVNLVTLDLSVQRTIVSNGHSPSWRR